MSKLFWAMLAFISRLPVPSRWSQGLISSSIRVGS